METNMAPLFIATLSVLFFQVQGTHIVQIEPEAALESHQVGGITSGAPIRFPEVRPAPQTQTSAGGYRVGAGANSVPRLGQAPRPKAAPHPAAPASHRPPGGSYNRPGAGGLNTAGAGYGNPHKNRNHIQKPYSIL